jgi:hypothetical protein
MKRRRGALLAALLFSFGVAARADVAPDESAETVFRKGVSALREGAVNEAVDSFEALADRGFVHPDASFDRSLSYLGRIRAGIERPGDLGRAAAALEETLLFRPDDREAESALELVRAEVARRRARSGSSADVESRPTLERAMLGIASEWTWSLLAAASSLLLTLGLLLRMLAVSRDEARIREGRAPEGGREGVLHLASQIAIPIGGACLLVFAGLAAGSRHLRLTTREGVVVTPEAHLVTERGALVSGASIPEAARVEIGETRGSLVHVRWGSIEGWTQTDAVRRLARP